MGNRNLIYCAAFGDAYQRLAGMLVDSLRAFGFDGDVVVLADKPFAAPGARVEVILDGVRERYILNRDPTRPLFRNPTADHRYDYIAARMWLDRFIDLSPYRYVMYLDCDVLATGDVTPLFYETDAALLAVPRDAVKLLKGCYELAALLTPTDAAFARTRAKSNVGMVGIPAALAVPLLERWRTLYETYTYDATPVYRKWTLLDETVFNVLLARREFAVARSRRWGFYKPGFPPDRVLHHFAGDKAHAAPAQRAVYEQYVAPRMAAGRRPTDLPTALPKGASPQPG